MKRGDVYWMDICNNVEHMNQGRRPVLIVSNDKCNEHSPCINVVPLTTARKKNIPTHVSLIMNNTLNIVLCEQITLINKSEIQESNYICTLSSRFMDLISIALMKQLGIMEV